MPDPHVGHAATIVPVRSVSATVRFYVDVLDFAADFVAGDESLGIVKRGGAMVQLLRTDSEDALKATRENVAIYINVRDLDGLYASLADRLAQLPAGRVRTPFEQPYGMREFHVKDPDGCLLFFGEDIAE